MEPSATLARWDDDRLTVFDAVQHGYNQQFVLASVFGITPENVRVVCPHTGGGFGSKGYVWPHEILAAAAAQVVGRPVKLVLTRAQMYANVGYQPQMEQAITLGVDSGGRLTSLTTTSGRAPSPSFLRSPPTCSGWIPEPSAVRWETRRCRRRGPPTAPPRPWASVDRSYTRRKTSGPSSLASRDCRRMRANWPTDASAAGARPTVCRSRSCCARQGFPSWLAKAGSPYPTTRRSKATARALRTRCAPSGPSSWRWASTPRSGSCASGAPSAATARARRTHRRSGSGGHPGCPRSPGWRRRPGSSTASARALARGGSPPSPPCPSPR
jgi:hypothetical protein